MPPGRIPLEVFRAPPTRQRPWSRPRISWIIYVIYLGNASAYPRRSWKMLLWRGIWNTQLIQLITHPSLCCHFASFIKSFFLHSAEEGTAVWERFFSGPPSAILCKFKLWIHKWASSLPICAEAFFMTKVSPPQSVGNHKWWQYVLHTAALSCGLLLLLNICRKICNFYVEIQR